MIHCVNPEHHLGYFLQGLSLKLQEKYEDAIACCDKTIKLKPNFPFPYYTKYTLLLQLNKNEEAEECRKIAIKLDPDGDYPPVSNDKKRM